MKYFFTPLGKSTFIILIVTVSYFIIHAQSIGNTGYVSTSNNNQINTLSGALIPYYIPPGVDLSVASPKKDVQVIKSSVMINSKATSYTAIFSVTQYGKTSIEAEALMEKRVNTFLNKINKASLKVEHHLDFISLVPYYSGKSHKFSRTKNELPVGFEMKKNVHITFGKHDNLQKLIVCGGEAEIYDLAKVEYNVENMDNIYAELRVKAAEIFKKKFEARKKLGFKLNMANMTENSGSVYPMERYASYISFNQGTSMNVDQRKKENEITHASGGKTRTIYYERVPYNQFDYVFNEKCVEPSVQFFLYNGNLL